MDLFGDASDIYLRFALGLGVVLGLIILCTWALKYLKAQQTPWSASQAKRQLKIQETLLLDDKRRLLLLEGSGQTYLILLGAQTETLLDQWDSASNPSTKPKLKEVKGRK